jgi:hypothetical protein
MGLATFLLIGDEGSQVVLLTVQIPGEGPKSEEAASREEENEH